MFSEAQYNPVGSYIKYFDLDKNMCGDVYKRQSEYRARNT